MQPDFDFIKQKNAVACKELELELNNLIFLSQVKSDDGREYQVHNSGYSYTWSTGSPSPSSSSQCTPMVPKPAAMCVGATDSCSSLGLQDHQCPDFGVCCFNGCVNACMPRDQVTREYEARVARLAVLPAPTCPVVESKTEAQCVNATANCWSRGQYHSHINTVIKEGVVMTFYKIPWRHLLPPIICSV